MKSNYIDFPLEHTDYMAHLTWPNGDAPTLRGIVTTSTGIPVEKYLPVVRTTNSIEEIPYVQNQIVATLSQHFRPKSHAKPNDNDNQKLTPIETAFEEVISSNMLVGKWKSNAHISYFRRKVMPYIKGCVTPEDFTEEDLDIMVGNLEKISLHDPNSYGRTENAKNNVHNHLVAASYIYNLMRRIDPLLPNIKLVKPKAKTNRYNKETHKSIPVKSLLPLRHMIQDHISTSPYYARALSLLCSAGPRPAESAAITESNIIRNPQMTSVSIDSQETNLEKDYELKTPAAYRTIPLDFWTSEITNTVSTLIPPESFSSHLNVSKTELSKIAKKMLKTCGLSKKFFDNAEEEMTANPVVDVDGMPMTNPTAYVLRRNTVSIWTNYLGLSKDEVDYLIGHERYTTGTKRFDEKNPNAMLELASKINYFDIEKALTKKPYITHSLEDLTTISIMPNNAIEYCNTTNDTLTAEVLITTAEPGEVITINSTDGTIMNPTYINERVTSRRQVTMIGTVEEDD